MFLLLFFLSFFNLATSLQCRDHCSMNYSMSEKFILPSNCHYISANHCAVKLVFWYNRGNYSVTFTTDSFDENNTGDNRHFLMIEIGQNQFFSYDIHHVCKEMDDCARLYAEQKVLQMIQRAFNITRIYLDLQRILYQKSAVSRNLACFDMTEAVRQCTIPGMSGSCQIIDDLIKHKFHRRLCLHSSQDSASVNIYDSGNFAIITIKCNRMLCNGPMTIAAVKRILQYHNITDVNGRISGSNAQILLTRYLFLLTSFLSFRMK